MSDTTNKTQPSWSSPEDARKNTNAGQYPNYHSTKTRSGHLIMMDDSNGAEHVTIQHRSGSMIQFMPDGAVQYVSHKGQYSIIFGENRILVSGAQDIVVQGDASLKIDGDYNVNVQGDMNLNVTGDLNMTAKNNNQTIRGNIDIISKNKVEKIEGSVTTQTQGSMSILSQKGMTIASADDSLAIGAKKQIGINAKSGALTVKSGGKTSFKAGDDFAVDAPKVYLNSDHAEDVESVFTQSPATPPEKEPDIIT
jgi:environmental stress-induced protein Ves